MIRSSFVLDLQHSFLRTETGKGAFADANEFDRDSVSHRGAGYRQVAGS